MNKIAYIFISIFLISLYACETPFTPDDGEYEPEVVVEGYIEAGDVTTVPYVLLTESQPFFSELSFNDLNKIFIHDAEVTVSNGIDTVVLEELCLSDIKNSEIQDIIELLFDINLDTVSLDFCVYTDLSFLMRGEIGATYDLTVKTNHKTLTATTTIPELVRLDTFRFKSIPDTQNDTLKELIATLTDPTPQRNFYRYFTSTNGGQLLPGLQSVHHDKLVDGTTFDFGLPRAQSRFQEFDVATYGYFKEGDRVTVKWTCIDEAHYDFWETLEFNASNQGPFSSYTRVSSNIHGGLGIWGGYSSQYFTTTVPED